MFKFLSKKKMPIEIIENYDESCEEGFVDLEFKIIKMTIKDDYYIIDTQGYNKNRLLQLRFYVAINMEGMNGLENLKESFKFYKEGIKIESMGKYSDEFLKVLAELYRLPVFNGKMKKEIKSTCVALQDSPLDLTTQKVCFKSFFNEDDEDKYSELFINFDIPNNLVEIREKDQDYRENIIKSFMQV